MSSERAPKFSHADYMRDRLHRALMALRYEDQFPVERLAELAGCSTSLIYQWSSLEGFESAKAHYLFALGGRLAEAHGNFRLVHILLPVGARIALGDEMPAANGNCDDEHVDAGLATSKAVLAHRGRDEQAIREAAQELRDVAKRLDHEAAVLAQPGN